MVLHAIGKSILLAMAVMIALPAWSMSEKAPNAERVPAHYDAKKGLPRTLPKVLDPATLPDHSQQAAYAIAKKHSRLLAQLPCYCYCDRIGHRSLLSCFADHHGADCTVCMQEAFLAAELAKKGLAAEKIRQAVIHGDWRKIDLQTHHH
ncbi:MAG: hypothetical protein HY692_04695 [Cyanobacteria bacterium NC_groundwater_1444_Ag_S-0.65um_54_12]|nr:hypothetical protein [Cyanobacteria bacterium NC_groundwater_1444_Ag_S-0.65um_54_12]